MPRKNYVPLMKKYKGNLQKALECNSNSPFGMGLEFRPISTLDLIFKSHPVWPRMKEILTHGSQWPMDPLNKDLHQANVEEALAFGNHKGASKHPTLPQELVKKDIKFGYCMLLPLHKALLILGLLIAPMNIQDQHIINEYSRIIDKK
jgi:hypothetical protein